MALYAKRQQSSEANGPIETPSSRILVSNINHHTFYCQGDACLRNHDLTNYQMDLFNTYIFWKAHGTGLTAISFIFIDSFSKKKIFNKEANVINFQCCLHRKPREVRFHWLQVEAALSIWTSYFLFKHARKLQFLIFTWLMIHLSPKENYPASSTSKKYF